MIDMYGYTGKSIMIKPAANTTINASVNTNANVDTNANVNTNVYVNDNTIINTNANAKTAQYDAFLFNQPDGFYDAGGLNSQNLGESFIDEYRRVKNRKNHIHERGIGNTRSMNVSRIEFNKSRGMQEGELAAAREASDLYKQQLLRMWNGSLVCISLNMPGLNKEFPLASLCFKECQRATEVALEAGGIQAILQESPNSAGAGDIAYYLVKGPPEAVKRLLCEIEDSHPLGRLFNLDIYVDSDSITRLSRKDMGIARRSRLPDKGDGETRAGKTCDGNTREGDTCAGKTYDGNTREGDTCAGNTREGETCDGENAHSTDELVSGAISIMWVWARRHLAERINKTSTRALCSALATTPKPGLIDRANCGVYSNTDYFIYFDSLVELTSYCQECALTGFDSAAAAIESRTRGYREMSRDLPMLPRDLRYMGELAQVRITRAAGGANMHKSLIFQLGILSAAYGWLIRSKTDFTVGELFDLCRDLTEPVMDYTPGISQYETDMSAGGAVGATVGTAVGAAMGPAMGPAKGAVVGAAVGTAKGAAVGTAKGTAKGVAQGFSHVHKIGLPMMRDMLERGYPMNDAGIAAFVALLAHVDDTAIVRRSNKATLREIQNAASSFLSDAPSMQDIKKWAVETDSQFIERDISAEDCADLLAVTFFAWYLL